jgi:hypothetical protein
VIVGYRRYEGWKKFLGMGNPFMPARLRAFRGCVDVKSAACQMPKKKLVSVGGRRS